MKFTIEMGGDEGPVEMAGSTQTRHEEHAL